MPSDSPDNFRDVQYYAMLKEMYHVQHVGAKSTHISYCACSACSHAWRGECMRDKCTCCTQPVKR